ncbi:nitronate monooxygenase [Streptomyces sp. NPDC093109]|uniref:NAD(P)H-dependent flavin oxidoreductase n=1 Tax=Streptomyces sp. NPDC093109 TaxID=3154977 RepID=UPI00344CF734
MTALASLLGLELPLVQAGMGGVAGPELCLAVSGAGAAGTLALYKEPPERVRALVTRVAEATGRPFGVNLVPEVLSENGCLDRLDAALERLPRHGFVSFFGLPGAEAARRVRAADRGLLIQVGTPGEAELACRMGSHAVVLQGVEAGGHLLGSLPGGVLLRETRARLPRAVLVLAGGIASGRDLARAVADGADGAMAGTLFVPSTESAAHPLFKDRVVAAGSRDTVVTSVFDIGWPGRRHRVLRNPLTGSGQRRPATFIAVTEAGGRRLPVPRYSAAVPVARTTGRVAEMAMYCGVSCAGVSGRGPAGHLVRRLRQEFQEYQECLAAGGNVFTEE